MKKTILNFGKTLSKVELKQINGSSRSNKGCKVLPICPPNYQMFECRCIFRPH